MTPENELASVHTNETRAELVVLKFKLFILLEIEQTNFSLHIIYLCLPSASIVMWQQWLCCSMLEISMHE